MLHFGVPGTSQYLNGRDLMMFKQEKDHLEAQEKVLDLFTQIYEAVTQVSG